MAKGLYQRSVKYIKNMIGGSNNKKVINFVRLQGQIDSGTSPKSLNLNHVNQSLKNAFNIDGDGVNPTAVCLLINSPGGSPVQSNLISNQIRKLSKKTKIPVYAFAEDVAASGGYMLLSAADECYANQFSIIGSIGVISFGFGLKDKNILYDQLGIEPRIQTAGDNKFRNNPFEPWKEEDKIHKKYLLTKLHEIFVNVTQLYRNGKLPADENKIKQVFSGDVFNAEDSKKLGLIDGIGDMEAIMEEKYGEVEFNKIVKKASFFEKILLDGPFGGFSSSSSHLSLSAGLDNILNSNKHRFF